MTNAVMKRVCNRKSYRESRELPVRMPQCAAERDRWNVTEDGLLSGVDETDIGRMCSGRYIGKI